MWPGVNWQRDKKQVGHKCRPEVFRDATRLESRSLENWGRYYISIFWETRQWAGQTNEVVGEVKNTMSKLAEQNKDLAPYTI